MINDWFVVHDGLAGAARLPSLARSHHRISVAELLMLFGCGAVSAAAVGYVKLGLGIPGHAIVLAALPMALGMALAPRRLAGCTMSAGAVGTAVLLASVAHRQYGSGAFVSLTLLGPMMDLALRKVERGWRVYAGLITAGLVTNALALASRASTKLLGLDPGRPFDSWWLQAMVTYSLSGIVAGLLGALCWFHLTERAPRRPPT
jgi:hypothetical protein